MGKNGDNDDPGDEASDDDAELFIQEVIRDMENEDE